MKKDLNSIAALEKAIAEKYGNEAAINPKSLWTPQKEIEYLNQSKQAQVKEALSEKTQEKVEFSGILIAKKLLNKNTDRHCQFCKCYSFDRNDDLYFTKFRTCYKCFVVYIDGREERWANGWRPEVK